MQHSDLEENELLLVDDNSGIIVMLRHTLQNAGYQVRVAMSGAEAIQSIDRFGVPSLAIIDINMPGMDGFELARYLRQQSHAPIIIISAQTQPAVIVEALSEFADDYLVKPFTGAELLARIERVLRRAPMSKAEDWVTVDEHLCFSLTEQQAKMNGFLIDLTPLEAKLLQLLATWPEQTAAISWLCNKLWPFEEATVAQLRVVVSRLRQKLQQVSDHNYIATERGVGYRLEKYYGA